MTALQDQRILVTGGAGFIGSRLADRLCRDNDVVVLDSLVSGDRENVPAEAEFIEGDIRDESAVADAIAGVDCVFHEAALVSVDRSVEVPTESHDNNVEGTLTILEAARSQDTRVVLASSAAIYGRPAEIPITENHPKEPTSPYGLDKLACDHYARLYHDRYGTDTVALRYFNAYGPGQTGGDYAGVISIFIEQALAGEDITVEGDGEQTRDFVYIDDIVDANVAAAGTAAVGAGYNVGTGDSVTIRELAELIQDITDTDSDIVHTDPREGDIDHSRAAVSKAKANLDFEASVPLREGLERTVEWFRGEES
ncbi:NAD-dependent epimerase/dehydratase family protein [Halobacteriaceae archaeon SHR40]|uniref:NAD-dependent epimerase/dehydratase family protein n=1 Tax=Halovenus amylolytica TaxID=2500550 RepID=UPI000FE34F12